MNKKSLLGLILFAVVVTAVLFMSAHYLSLQDHTDTKDYTNESNVDVLDSAEALTEIADSADSDVSQEDSLDITKDSSSEIASENSNQPSSEIATEEENTFSTAMNPVEAPELIVDSSLVDYQSYIPDMKLDSQLEAALDIDNPSLSIDAEAAILMDAETLEVLYYKNAVKAKFPASTAKLLTTLVALSWCELEEQVAVGDEITMIASDSTRAYLEEGEVLTLHNLLEGLLLPSGNDAAYTIAAYVGRKALDNPEATKEQAVSEFVQLMNEEAASLGVKNSCFKTPDGYDAIGQYTTAYDMCLIGAAAAKNSTITEITQKSTGRNRFISGEDVTWKSTNKLITQYSGQFYSNAIGLKTGTSSLAGRCLVAAAEEGGRKVVCAILDSTSAGRWEDAITLLKYGLE
ncbi:MAG: putative rane protein [Herbinix sp.]|jgi:D-alanyl-D-alanine carboxypeptidase (penicillin-binding protein 5/6)|nr:putative rane protein [Herbinix sp.]